jgi:SAM-dependent MidA family methyltransferase
VKELTDKICSEIARRGAISLADFMRLALYCPVYGYYEREKDIIGAGGDYYTSASTGPLFGQLLAFQFCAWFGDVAGVAGIRQLEVVEAGAHDGVLARDILSWIKAQRPAMFDRFRYWIVEPSVRRQAWQRETLGKFSQAVRWVESFPGSTTNASCMGLQTASAAGMPALPGNESSYSVVFSNELLDAMPVHRVAWDAQKKIWFEWGVTVENERFAWQRMPLTPGLQDGKSMSQRFDLTDDLLAVLPDGFTIEVCPEAERWWREAAKLVRSGKVVTIDYGLRADEFLLPHRKSGTLRAYYKHDQSDDVLSRPGEQDITAHVNFSALQAAGENMGMRTAFFATQAQFLTSVFSELWKESEGVQAWRTHATRQFQTLTHPDHLGRAFRVLVQERRLLSAES